MGGEGGGGEREEVRGVGPCTNIISHCLTTK